MKIDLPSDCGNSPRMVIVGEFTSKWAVGDTAGCEEWLAEDSRWVRMGRSADEVTGAETAVPRVLEVPLEPERVEVLSIVTHGRLAACDGYMVRAGERIDFCHMLRFAGATKTAKIAEIRTYIAEGQPAQ